MWQRIRFIIRKEVFQVLRDPRMRLLLIGPPMIQLIIFGYAVNLDVENSRVGLMDRDKTTTSRKLIELLNGSQYFHVVAEPLNEREITNLLDHGKVEAVIQIPSGFARDVQRGATAQVQVLVDGTNSNTAAIVSNYLTQLLTGFSSELMRRQVEVRLVGATLAAGGPVTLRIPSVDAKARSWFNPDLRSQDYFIPGVVVNIIGLVTVMMTAMAIVREKEIGTMEQLMVTPIRPIELMLGKTLPFAVVGLLEVCMVTTVALLVFKTPLRGSVLLLLGCAVLFLFTTLGTGLLISTLSGTQQQAMMGSFFFFLPAFMLSGFAFPIRNMPEIVQYLTYLNAVRYIMEIFRGIFLKGTGLAVLWPQMLALTGIGVAMILFSAFRFHKRLD